MSAVAERISSLPYNEAKGLLTDALKQAYQESLYHTAKKLFGYSEITERTHGKMIAMLENDSKLKLIVVPRGCFKSSIASVSYPVWRILKNPNLRILIDSELYSNSSKFLREIKGHLLSDKVVRLFGESYNPLNWNEGEITVKQRTVVKKEASITCSGIGAQKTSQHYDIIIADDLNSPDNSGTSEAREKVISHYQMYISLLEPGGTLVIIGTRYAEDDVIGHILANEVSGGKD
jgi:hypothetical protein